MNEKSESLVSDAAARIAPQVIDDVRKNITGQMISFLEGQIAHDFPKEIDAICNTFFNQEITPGLLVFLRSHKDEIAKRLEDKIIDYAINRILKNFDNDYD